MVQANFLSSETWCDLERCSGEILLKQQDSEIFILLVDCFYANVIGNSFSSRSRSPEVLLQTCRGSIVLPFPI